MEALIFEFLSILSWGVLFNNNSLTNWAFQNNFHILFYRFVLFLNHSFVLPYLEILILLSILRRHILAKKR